MVLAVSDACQKGIRHQQVPASQNPNDNIVHRRSGAVSRKVRQDEGLVACARRKRSEQHGLVDDVEADASPGQGFGPKAEMRAAVVIRSRNPDALQRIEQSHGAQGRAVFEKGRKTTEFLEQGRTIPPPGLEIEGGREVEARIGEQPLVARDPVGDVDGMQNDAARAEQVMPDRLGAELRGRQVPPAGQCRPPGGTPGRILLDRAAVSAMCTRDAVAELGGELGRIIGGIDRRFAAVARAFADQPYLVGVAFNSLLIGLWTTLICAVLGFSVALALVRTTAGRAREVLLLLVILPFWTNGLVRVFSWTMVIRDGGFLDVFVRWFWASAPSLGFLYTNGAIVLGLVHGYLPYMVLTCYVALSSVEEAIVEAATSLGARWPTVLTHVLLPLSAPGLLSGSVLIFVPVIGSFMEPRILGGPRGVTMGTVIEEQFTQAFNWPLGSALSFTILAAVLAVFATFSGVLRRNASF